MNAHDEVHWDYESIFCTENIKSLAINAHNIANVMDKMSCKSLANIKWSSQVYCTENFVSTVACESAIDEYLRIPDMFVRFPSGDILILSDREANVVLPLFRSKIESEKLIDYYFGHLNKELIGNTRTSPIKLIIWNKFVKNYPVRLRCGRLNS